jgi:hypothetical protein
MHATDKVANGLLLMNFREPTCRFLRSVQIIGAKMIYSLSLKSHCCSSIRLKSRQRCRANGAEDASQGHRSGYRAQVSSAALKGRRFQIVLELEGAFANRLERKSSALQLAAKQTVDAHSTLEAGRLTCYISANERSKTDIIQDRCSAEAPSLAGNCFLQGW